jgi:perosamine synthetase
MAIPYGRQTIEDDDIQAVVATLRGDWLTQGPAVEAFESAVAVACDAPYAVAFSSGTAALHAAAYAAGVGPGDELITSALTFAASANCAAYVGGVPRFADIDPATLNVSAGTVARVVGDRTRAVVPVHFAGLPAPVAEIRATLPDRVRLIEDAAHALGSVTDGEPVGSCQSSDMAVFSFHPVKAVTSAEGGIVTTRDPALAETLRLFRSHGLTKDPARLHANHGGWYQEQQLLGFNYRLTDVHAALGASQMQKLGRFVGRRNEVAARYREAFAHDDAIELPPAAAAGSVHAYHLFVVRFPDRATRRRVYDGLREREIYAQVHYLPVHLNPWYRETFGYAEGLAPEAEAYYERCLSLPCYPTLGDAEQQKVVDAVRELVD